MSAKVVGDVIVVESQDQDQIFTVLSRDEDEFKLGRADGCKIGGTIHPDGTVEGPYCVNEKCSGYCEMKSKVVGDKTVYWCDCIALA